MTALKTEAESQQSDEDLVAQLQSLLDEASDEEARSMVSPAEVLNDNAAVGDTDLADDDDGLDGGFEAPPTAAVTPDEAPTIEAASQVAESATEESEPSAEAPPLIEQIDTLLADHAEEAISGEFESVDELLGVNDTSGQYMADPTEDSAEDNADDDDGLDSDFQSMDELLAQPGDEAPAEAPPAKPEPAATPTSARREEPAKELDEIDGLFAAPVAMRAEPAVEADTPETQDDDLDAEGGFESLDAMLAAPPPSEEDRDGAPPKPQANPSKNAKTKTQTKTKAKANTDSDAGWEITLNLKMLRASVLFALGWMLWTCAILNKPLDKLPSDIKQTVGWVALAIAGPGLLLVVYGLLLN